LADFKHTVVCGMILQTPKNKLWAAQNLTQIDGKFRARPQNCEKRLLSSSCLSVSPHATTRFPVNGFS